MVDVETWGEITTYLEEERGGEVGGGRGERRGEKG